MIKTHKLQRILHIVSAMSRGGAETLLMNVHRNLDSSKVQFDYVSHSDKTCDYDDEIEALGGKVFRIPSLGQTGPIRYINGLKKIMSAHDYTAVHAHTDYQSGFATLAAKMVGINKRICHSHSNNWGRSNGLKGELALKALRAIIKYSATDCCACSVDAACFLFGKDWANANKVRVLKNGIDLDEFIHFTDRDESVRQELNIAPETKIIGHVGRFSPSKNHQFSLRIIKRMLEGGQQVAAVFVGDGPLMQQIEYQAKQLGIYNHTRFLGVRNDIPRLMRAFDVFLFPSLFEGFGIVTLEAQASGTPCVAADSVPKATDIGMGLMAFVGLDHPIEDWIKEIDNALLIERPDTRQIYGQFLSSGFDIKQNIEEWMTVYGIK